MGILSVQTGTNVTIGYTWDYRDRLIKVTETDAGTTTVTTYAYDAENRRLLETDVSGGSTTSYRFLYDGSSLAMELNLAGGYNNVEGTLYLTNPTSSASSLLAGGPAPLAQITVPYGVPQWMLTDVNGSVQDVVQDSSTNGGVTVTRTLVDHVVFDAYGNKIVADTSLSSASLYGFQGMLQDPGTELGGTTSFAYYDNARWYSTSTGTFLSQDPLGYASGSDNLHEFAGDNPITNEDPSGLMFSTSVADNSTSILPVDQVLANTGAPFADGNSLSSTNLADDDAQNIAQQYNLTNVQLSSLSIAGNTYTGINSFGDSATVNSDGSVTDDSLIAGLNAVAPSENNSLADFMATAPSGELAADGQSGQSASPAGPSFAQGSSVNLYNYLPSSVVNYYYQAKQTTAANAEGGINSLIAFGNLAIRGAYDMGTSDGVDDGGAWQIPSVDFTSNYYYPSAAYKQQFLRQNNLVTVAAPLVLPVLGEVPVANGAGGTAKFLSQGFNQPQANYLAQPYDGMGHHFIPRAWGLPQTISDSPFNVLSPQGLSRGDFYELHYQVDPNFYGAAFPQSIGGSWSGSAIGLQKYGLAGQLWYGSPAPLKIGIGAAAATTGLGAASLYYDGNK